MEILLQDILALLQRAGPWLVFLVTASETAFFIGLLIPAEATVLLAAFLAYGGTFELSHVLIATIAGGFVGDQIGYLLGRYGGNRVAASHGRIGRLWRRYERAAQALFRRRSLVAVSLARFVSFVRTLMPWFAGMSGMSWPRYALFDLIGVLGWGGLSVLAGYAAGRSWHVVADALGLLSSLLIVVLLLAGFGWFRRQRRRRFFRVGLTGNIASGKSAVAATWQRLGAHIIDADELARIAVAPGTDALAQIEREFGAELIAADGTLDRAALRQIVFRDPARRAALEDIIHPEVQRLRRDRERELGANGVAIVVNVIPLLFEAGLETMFDEIVFVDAPESQRRDRIVRDRGLSPEEADAMIAAQQPATEKRARATRVIDNTGTLEELERAAEMTWNELNVRAPGA